MTDLIKKLQEAKQNSSGLFEIDEDTICELMDILTVEPVAFYADGAYYNTAKAAFKDGAEDVTPLYVR